MKIDLTNEVVFEENEIDFNKNINFIFGKNGTGKSTITKLIKEQTSDYDVHIFQGFAGVVDENKQLNAVVLGEVNTVINKQIEVINNDINDKETERNKILKTITKPEGNEKNFWTRLKNAENAIEVKQKEIREFNSSSASKIKKMANPQISKPSYDSRCFQSEIAKAKLLQDTEMVQLKEILKSEPKKAVKIEFPVLSLNDYLNEINDILHNKVEEKVKISRLENNNDKRNFAEKGLRIHQKGDICAFCGSTIKNTTFEELESYFSADEVKVLQDKIAKSEQKIQEEILKLDNFKINEKDFYPEFNEEFKKINSEIKDVKNKYLEFLKQLFDAINEKKGNLFAESNDLKLEIPDNFIQLETAYKRLVDKNNEGDLPKKQQEATDKLRFNEIYKLLQEFKYDVKQAQSKDLERERENNKEALDKETAKVTGENGLKYKISLLQSQIKALQAQTKSERKLAENINSKLKHFVAFELEYCENEKGKRILSS